MTKTWCVGGRHFSKTINQNVYENLNSTTKKFVEVIKGNCSVCGRNKSQLFSN